MTALFLFLVVGLWAWVAYKLSRWIGGRIPLKQWQIPFAILAFVVLLVAPLVGELVGWWQFESLCDEYAVQLIDEKAALNAHVVSVGGKLSRYESGTAVRIKIQPWIYQDSTSGKVIVSYHTISAEGGWLIHALSISETNSPLLFSRSCAPVNERGFIKRLNITIIN
jgi:hypothetical protein